MECSHELEELLRTVFNLNSREIDVLMTLCDGEMKVDEMAEQMDLDRSTVQRYVSGLRKTGLISRRKEGRKHVYSVDTDSLKREASQRLEAWVDEKRKAIEDI